MQKQILLCALSLIAGASSALSAISIGLVTFETDQETFFRFAQNSASTSTVYPATGSSGNGIGLSVDTDPGTFVGGGLGSSSIKFDLALAGITAGSVTVADIDKVIGSFDINAPSGQEMRIRIEPRNGGSGQGIVFPNFIATGAFQTVNFDVASSTTDKAILVNHLNGGSETGLKFVFQPRYPSTTIGSVFVIDNVELQVIPEPSAVALLGISALALLRRRR